MQVASQIDLKNSRYGKYAIRRNAVAQEPHKNIDLITVAIVIKRSRESAVSIVKLLENNFDRIHRTRFEEKTRRRSKPIPVGGARRASHGVRIVGLWPTAERRVPPRETSHRRVCSAAARARDRNITVPDSSSSRIPIRTVAARTSRGYAHALEYPVIRDSRGELHRGVYVYSR